MNEYVPFSRTNQTIEKNAESLSQQEDNFNKKTNPQRRMDVGKNQNRQPVPQSNNGKRDEVLVSDGGVEEDSRSGYSEIMEGEQSEGNNSQRKNEKAAIAVGAGKNAVEEEQFRNTVFVSNIRRNVIEAEFRRVMISCGEIRCVKRFFFYFYLFYFYFFFYFFLFYFFFYFFFYFLFFF
jgi:septum formation inhibitor MinC